MPSIKSKLLIGTMKSVKPLITSFAVGSQRKGLEMLRYMHPKNKSVELKEAEGCPLPGKWAIPADCLSGKALLYTHGGAYVSGSPSTHEPLICRLAEQCRLPVFAYEYRLAPEFPYPAALEDAAAAYAYLLGQGFAAQDVALCGDSAGGGLTLALTMKLRDEGKELPAALAVLSPWTDLTESLDSHYSNTAADPVISSEELREMALLYAGGADLHTPYISPLYGDFTGFPPTLIHVGSDEVLLDDSRELALRMQAQGVEVDIDVYEGMWARLAHVRRGGSPDGDPENPVVPPHPAPGGRAEKADGAPRRGLPPFQGAGIPGALRGAPQRNHGGTGRLPAALWGWRRLGAPAGYVFRHSGAGRGNPVPL